LDRAGDVNLQALAGVPRASAAGVVVELDTLAVEAVTVVDFFSHSKFAAFFRRWENSLTD
tara:strand:- start:41 stop:220 length:180 start_codon:yes stop_codon:yes gene_type:complete